MSLPRIYDAVILRHVKENRQMAFLAGPRQVGKTTLCRSRGVYLDWDNLDDKRVILAGPSAVANYAKLDQLHRTLPVVAFDELHKYGRWKGFLKGLFDTWETRARFIVTGSSRLDVFRRGGDSLMGRYFLYRIHPFSVAEATNSKVSSQLIRRPKRLDESDWEALWQHGGFPEPFVRRELRFTRRWQLLRRQQLLREDVRELARLHELGQLEAFATLMRARSGGQLVLSNLAQDVQISVDTARRWAEVLTALHVGFLVRPWFRNVSKSLRKEPKWYQADWSDIEEPGARFETMVACHLLKAVHFWQDLGYGSFELRYLRDKQRREADFLIVHDGKPWLIVEVKVSDTTLSPALAHFQQQTGAEYALQVVRDLDFVNASALTRKVPTIVPARTFLSQLV